jgi:hypothetical protein
MDNQEAIPVILKGSGKSGKNIQALIMSLWRPQPIIPDGF